MLQNANETGYINVNCVDPIGRSALLMAIDNENLEMIELLIENKVEMKDALLHAISEEYVEAVEVLLEQEETNRLPGEPQSWEAIDRDTATFTPDITPLILAAHRDNYEILKILLDRGSILPIPHEVRCGCDDCVQSISEDCLRHSRSRINAYRALSAPSLIALSSKDPILTAFELSWELRRLSFMEHEFKSEYQELRKKCQDFATALLDHTRSSYELEVLLNYDPFGPAFEHGDRMHLSRLKLAIRYKQKKFCAHPNVQQLLASIWYEGLPGFRRKNIVLQTLEIIRIGALFPLYSAAYILSPHSYYGRILRRPFIKFICHSASYITFLFLLILASQRIEAVVSDWFGTEERKIKIRDDITTKRGSPPSIVEGMILAWVAGKIFFSFFCVQREINENTGTASLPREKWDPWDPILIAEGIFATANVFSSLKLVYIFSVNPHLGPLQISLGRMVIDIVKFFFVYTLVLFAFACGLNQLLWYYADMEKQECMKKSNGNETRTDPSCLTWRRFANLFESSQTLFWASFGLIDLDNFELNGIQSYTRFWGLLMFGSYCVINVVVLLNLLIAMMNHSYQMISEHADVEWKFARCKLWMSYFEDGGTVPPPLNIIPTPKSLYYLTRSLIKHFRGNSKNARKEHLKTIRRKARQASERDHKYQVIMRNLVRRYITEEQRKADNQGVTEDDVNEIKQDISSFRYELIEILSTSGFNTSAAKGQGQILGFSIKLDLVPMPNNNDARRSLSVIMRNLVRRYITEEQRKADNQGVTEDDVNEIKQDISSFRYELIEILSTSGFNTSAAKGQGQSAGGKKGRQRERRLMKGFDIGLVEGSVQTLPEFCSTELTKKSPVSRMVKIARMAENKKKIKKGKWSYLVEATRNARSAFSRSRSEDSISSQLSSEQMSQRFATSPSESNSSVATSPGVAANDKTKDFSPTHQTPSIKRSMFARRFGTISFNPAKLRMIFQEQKNFSQPESSTRNVASLERSQASRTSSAPFREEFLKCNDLHKKEDRRPSVSLTSLCMNLPTRSLSPIPSCASSNVHTPRNSITGNVEMQTISSECAEMELQNVAVSKCENVHATTSTTDTISTVSSPECLMSQSSSREPLMSSQKSANGTLGVISTVYGIEPVNCPLSMGWI
ncbi:transient receptor potential-gamma protein-like [Centruroides sculpturatus]|uniref:transient receptor potential-gamma protein-like n=1 Tax=Centruroides sculpturatus TaxID=218467 RepID=UPI000C6CE994|nr:transient receptor potential-gamma protein-like [Centruroides sculpturatus]